MLYRFSGHYLIGQAGEILQVVPEDHVAQHVGGAGRQAYRLPRAIWARDYAWWVDRWPGFKSPRDLAGGKLWAGGSCNANTIGIEVAPPIEDPTAPWSDECWRALGSLVGDICVRHEIICARHTIVTHSDAHPRSRTARGRPYDPGLRQWSWKRFADLAGAVLGRGPPPAGLGKFKTALGPRANPLIDQAKVLDAIAVVGAHE